MATTDLIAAQTENRLWGPRQIRWTRILVAGFIVYMGFPALDFIGAADSTWEAVGLAALLGTFGVLYLRIVWVNLPKPHTNRTPWTLAAMGLLAVLMVAALRQDGLDIALMFGTATCVLSFRPRLWIPTALVALAIEAVLSVYVFGNTWNFTLRALLGTVTFAAVLIGFYQLIRLLTELGNARTALAHVAVTEERVRFARDLHDILGQRLSAAALRAELAGRTAASDPERSAREAFAASDLAREALADVRQAVTGYRRTTLADEVETATVLLNATGVDVVANVPEKLPEDVDELAGWVVREGATNVARHAHAERCWITVTSTDPYTVTVSDDGGGADSTWGNGLTGLAERLEPRGGELVTAERGGRFELRATIPGEGAE